MSVPKLYHIGHPTRRSKRPPVCVSILLRAPVGGGDFSCMFWRFLMITGALSLIPIMATTRYVRSHVPWAELVLGARGPSRGRHDAPRAPCGYTQWGTLDRGPPAAASPPGGSALRTWVGPVMPWQGARALRTMRRPGQRPRPNPPSPHVGCGATSLAGPEGRLRFF